MRRSSPSNINQNINQRVNSAVFIDALVRGDAQAFSELVRLYQGRIFNVCFRLLGSEEDARDVCQEVFLTVYRKIGGFKRDALLSTWLYRVATNHSLNRIRLLKRRGLGCTVALTPEMADRASIVSLVPRPDQLLDAKELEHYIQSELGKLEEDQRIVVVLRDIEGLTYQEVSEVTGFHPGTVKSRLHRGRTRLKEALERWLNDRAVNGGRVRSTGTA